MLILRFASGMLSTALIVLGAGVVSGQDFPSKAVRILTSPAGGGGDFAARILAQGISGPLGQPVIVDNRPTVLANELASKAPPDGYNLLATGGSLLVYPLLYKAPFNVADFSPISQITREVLVLAVHPSVPVKSVKELIALAKARPGELNYAMVPSGSASQLGGELFKSMAGVNIVSVPYKGAAPRLAAVVSGEAQLTMVDAGFAVPHVKSGKLRALAVTSAQPSALAPGLPTMAASGLPGYEMVGQTSLYAPAKTPATVIIRLNREVVRLLNQADVKERFLNGGVEAHSSSPGELTATIKSEIAMAVKLIKEAGIKGE